MVSKERALPVLYVSPVEAGTLGDALHSIEIDDEALAAATYQSLILTRVREAAGPAFDDLAERARGLLESPPWCLVVRGLPAAQATQLLVSFSATLGELIEPYRQSWSHVVRHIVPSRDRAVDGYVLNEFLHTDGTDWPRPNDYTCLFCVRPDQSGDGRSRLLDLDTLMNEIDGAPQEKLLARLAGQSVPWRIADELGGGAHWAPVIELGARRIRWLRYTVMLSCEDGLAALDDQSAGDLEEFERLVENCPGGRSVNLEAGDLLLVENTRCLHARTAISAPATSARELRRTKVKRPEVP